MLAYKDTYDFLAAISNNCYLENLLVTISTLISQQGVVAFFTRMVGGIVREIPLIVKGL